jgi:hypothetical protein
MADVNDSANIQDEKKPRMLRSEAKSIGVRKQYYKSEEKQEKLRERIALLYRQKEEIEKKILDLEKFRTN